MGTEPPKTTIIECLVERIGDTVLAAGFSPEDRVTLRVEYADEDDDTPADFVYIECGSKRTLSGVTLETMPQAIRKLGIQPDQEFSILVEDDEDAPRVESSETGEDGGGKSRMDRLLAKAGVGETLVGPQTTEEIDARIRKFRGDE